MVSSSVTCERSTKFTIFTLTPDCLHILCYFKTGSQCHHYLEVDRICSSGREKEACFSHKLKSFVCVSSLLYLKLTKLFVASRDVVVVIAAASQTKLGALDQQQWRHNT